MDREFILKIVKRKLLFLVAVLLVTLVAIVYGEELEVSGFADTFHAYKTSGSGDLITSKTRLRLEGNIDNEDSLVFFSLNAQENNVIEEQNEIELNEVYYDYYSDVFNLRMGKQIVVWGKSDGIDITNIISPKDYEEQLGVEYDDTKMAVDAFKITVPKDSYTLEGIWIPAYKVPEYPDSDNPWYSKANTLSDSVKIGSDTLNVTENYSYEDVEDSFSDSEIGFRLSAYLPLIDFSVSAFYGYNDDRYIERNIDVSSDEVNIDSEVKYYKTFMLGFDIAMPVSSFVFRVESAYFNDIYFSKDLESITSLSGKSVSDLSVADINQIEEELNPVKSDELKFLLGMDWSPGNDWSLTFQIADSTVMDYEDSLDREDNEVKLTCRVSKTLLRELVEIADMTYYDVNGGDSYNRFNIDYSLSDSLLVSVGSDAFIVNNDNKGNFETYEDNTCVWLKGKYDF